MKNELINIRMFVHMKMSYDIF